MPSAAATQSDPVLTITVDTTVPGGRTIPADFVGLSWEADVMHQPWVGTGTGDLAGYLRTLGPGSLRFSANTVDTTAWQNAAAPPPGGAVVTPADLARVDDLARVSGWPVDLGVNLLANNPAAAADEVHAAQAALGPRLRSVQIGNEPNSFPIVHAKLYTPTTYISDARAYRTAIDAAAPGVRYDGPDTSTVQSGPQGSVSATDTAQWIAAYLAAFGDNTAFLDEHYYPLGKMPWLANPAVLDQLDSRNTAAAARLVFDDLVRRGTVAGLPVHLSETNSVSGGGQAGITDTFGAALWTVDYLLSAAAAGIAGVGMHQQPYDCGSYTWLCFPDDKAAQSGRLHAEPPYYAGLLVARMTGGTFLPTSVSDSAANVAAHAVRMPDGHIRVVVEDLDRNVHRTINVRLLGTTPTAAAAQWLTGPNPDATDGVRYRGAEVTDDAGFAPDPDAPLETGSDGTDIRFDNPAAALLDFTCRKN